MSGVLKAIGRIAGTVAQVAAFIPGMQGFAAIAALVSVTANVGASLLAKPPPARGSVTQLLIAVDPPTPYVMGEGYYAGVLRYQRSYGATLKKVPNPYRFKAVVYSGGGPIESITPWVDQGAVSSWYSGFLYTTTRLGSCPDTALVPQWSGAPGWDSTSKLSGKASIGWSLMFDKDGKRFASGEPQLGAYGKWVKVYDPRKDSTRSGGSGSHRLGVESTYEWSENPALHAGTYAFGRYQNGRRVFGIGLPSEGINWENVAAWATVCDLNGWKLFGPIFEPGDRWANLRDIAAAGGGEPIPGAGPLTFHYSAPRVALDTITVQDLLADEPRSVVAMTAWAQRLNTIIPKYRSPAHNWEMVQADPVQISSYVTEDGEIKQAEWAFNLVKGANQAAQLARYRLEDSREMQPIELPCTLRLRDYRVGDCLNLDLLDELGLDGPAVIVKRRFDPQKMAVYLTLMTETPGKHPYALGQTGTAPPTPALALTGQQRDELLAGSAGYTRAAYKIVSQSVAFPMGSTADTITIAAFDAVLDDGQTMSFASGSLTGLAALTTYLVMWNLDTGTYEAIAPAGETAAMASASYVFLGRQATADSGGTYPASEIPPQGYGGGGKFWSYIEQV